MLRPRIPVLAVGFGGGVCVAGAAGPLSAAPLPWLALAVTAALAAALAAPRFGRWRTLLWIAAAVLAGGSAAAYEAAGQIGLPVLPAGAAADDRIPDEIRGVVAGPVLDGYEQRRFTVDLDAPAAGTVEVTVPGHIAVLPGDRVIVVGRLRTPRGYRVPGALELAGAAERRGVQLSMHARPESARVVGSAWTPWRAAARAQRAVSATLDRRGGDAQGRAVVRAMVAGDRGGLEQATSDRFRSAGIAHVLAVSGLHLAATALLLFAGLRRLWATIPALAARVDPARAAALLAAPAAVAYTLVTGARVSTLRALVVVLCVLAGVALRRRPRLMDSLAVAAFALLAVSPATLFDPSFQLSFAAAATLALVGTSQRPVWSTLHATFWISIAVAPITAAAFGAVQTGSIAANLVAVPMAELVILPLALAGVALSAVWEAGGGVLIDVAVVAASWLDEFAGLVAGVFPVLHVDGLSVLEILCAASVAGVLVLARGRARLWALAPAVLFAASYVTPRTPDAVVVTFLDVGQGDAAVVETPSGEVWLIDAGGLPFTLDGADASSPGEHSVARFLAHRRIRHIDVVVLSHPHPDHFAGLPAVLDAVSVGEVWVPRGIDYRDALDGLRVVHPPLGVARTRGGATLDVLAPRYNAVVAEADPVLSANDNSLVVRVSYAGRRVLFSGDLEEEGEEELISQARDLEVDVVKVPHHGSRTSSSPRFVAATRPGWVVISCGVANRFGFPAPEVEARWRRAGARVIRTDQRGAVTVRIRPDGTLTVATFDN